MTALRIRVFSGIRQAITPGFLLVGSEKYKSQDIHCKQIIIYVIVHDISLRALCPIFRTVADSCIHCSLMISTGMGGLFGRFTYSDWITKILMRIQLTDK